MRKKPFILLVVFMAFIMSQPVPAQATPKLFFDINKTAKAGRSSYLKGKLAQPDLSYTDRRFARVGSHLFFNAKTMTTGYELYYCTATTGSGKLAADINPGSGSSNPSEFLTMGGKVYFEATDGTNGYQIFEAAVGTTGVTVRSLTNLPGTSGAGYFGTIISFNKYIYFTFYDTVAKSYLIHRLDPVTKNIFKLSNKLTEGWTDPIDMGGMVAFGGRDSRGRESWWMDGSSAGLITDYTGGEGYFKYPVVINKIVYFASYTGTWDLLKWGPKLGMKKVISFPDGNSWITPMVIGTKIFYMGDHGGYSKPHVIDTTAAIPTIKVMPHESTITYRSGMNTPVVMNNKLYYYAHSSVQVPAGYYLFECDGVTARSIPGTGHHYTGYNWLNPLVVNGTTPTIYFSFKATGTGNSIYKFDGTNFGQIRRIQKNLYRNATPLYLTELGGKVIFGADDGSFGYELWESDGTAPGTRIHTNIAKEPQTLSSNPSQFVAMGRKLYFAANDGIHGSELWVIDSNPAVDEPQGARLVTDLNPGLASANPQGLVGCAAMKLIFFHANDGTGVKLMVMDIDKENPIQVGGNATSAKLNGDWAFASKTGDYLVALASDPTANIGNEPHIYNKTTNKLELVSDTNPGSGNGEFKMAIDLGESMFGWIGAGDRVFTSKGKPATTKVISPPGQKTVGELKSFKMNIVYSAVDATGKQGGYAYNRTTKSTYKFQSTPTTTDMAMDDPFVSDKLYYRSSSYGPGYLYSWDGQQSQGVKINTTPFYYFTKFHNSQTQQETTALPIGNDGDQIFFPATSAGGEIWKVSNNSAKRLGTTAFQTISDGISLGSDRVAVIGKTGANGEEVFVIDDTKVSMVSEPLAPGYGSGAKGGGLWGIDGLLFFTGNNYSVCGAEPFVWSTGALAQSYGISGYNGVRMTATDPVLGKTLTLGAHQGKMNGTAFAAMLSTPNPYPMVFFDGNLYLNMSNLMVFIGGIVQGSGIVGIPLPSYSGLIGLELDGQAIVIDIGLAMGLSQAISLRLGN